MFLYINPGYVPFDKVCTTSPATSTQDMFLSIRFVPHRLLHQPWICSFRQGLYHIACYINPGYVPFDKVCTTSPATSTQDMFLSTRFVPHRLLHQPRICSFRQGLYHIACYINPGYVPFDKVCTTSPDTSTQDMFLSTSFVPHRLLHQPRICSFRQALYHIAWYINPGYVPFDKVCFEFKCFCLTCVN